MDWDKATDIVLYAAFGVLAVFLILAITQLIRRKSLKKVDVPLLAMVAPLALAIITYIIFDKFLIVSTRPNGSGEPSFPSTHVMIVATIFALTAIALPYYIKSRLARIALDFLMLALIVITAIGRVLANMHWPADVAGGLVFSALFAVVYYLTIRSIKNVQHLHEDH